MSAALDCLHRGPALLARALRRRRASVPASARGSSRALRSRSHSRKLSITTDDDKRKEASFWVAKLEKAAAGNVDLDFRESRHAERQNLIVTQNKSL